MIVPLTYFIEKPFLNWTRQNTEQIGSISLRVDDVWVELPYGTGWKPMTVQGDEGRWGVIHSLALFSESHRREKSERVSGINSVGCA